MIVAGSLDYENPSSIQKEQIDEWVKLGIIEWSGYVKDMPNLLSQSSVVCLPSYYPEGVPKSLIEAASCGRAIITSDMPGCNEIVENILPSALKTQLYKALLDSSAAEHGARMTAMHSATENAGDLLQDLKITYNKARQTSITTEILEIVAGSEALGG